MCGILGIKFFNQEKNIQRQEFLDLLKIIKYRGPDDFGVFQDKNFSFGINRLSIIDTKGGHQPITSENNEYKIIFNGEIYNYLEIKNELKDLGYKFSTNSDTEVVLYAFEEFGIKCLEKFNGMFAFAIYKTSNGDIFIARDRFGKKPLYFTKNEELFLFSSELGPIIQSKLIKNLINYQAIYDLLTYWYVAEPKTIIKNVSQLPPGHYLEIKNNNLTIHKWWNFEFKKNNLNLDDSSAYLEELIENSVKIRLNSDVKVATTLSGGIDSGIVSYFYNKLYRGGIAYSLDFKEKSYSEYSLANLTAKKIKIPLIKIDYIDNKKTIENILEQIDEPLGNASFVASYQIFKGISKNNTKVVLTGDGADELFGGYPTYQSEYYYKFFNTLPNPIFNLLKNLIKYLPVSQSRISFDYKIKQLLKYIKLGPLNAHPEWRKILNTSNNKELFTDFFLNEIKDYNQTSNYLNSYKNCDELDLKNKLMFADFQNYLLNDHLRKIDRSSMLNSVEARNPFLDYRIVNFAYSLDSKMKVNFFNLKIILKNIAKKYLDNKNINSQKLGLTPPINYWIRYYFKETIDEIMRAPEEIFIKTFNMFRIKVIINEHFSNKVDHSRFIWTLISVFYWYKKNKKFISN